MKISWDIIFLIIICLIIIYQSYDCNNETFNNTVIHDDEATRNLDSIAKKIINGGNLIIPGTINFGPGLKMGGTDALPVGSIIAINTGAIPAGWLPCDGRGIGGDFPDLQRVLGPYGGKVPDLRGRVILGIDNNRHNTVGGAENHTLTVHELPAHNHGRSTGVGDHTHSYGRNNGHNTAGGAHWGRFAQHYWEQTSPAGSHTHGINNTGGGQAHPNMQPFFVLNYIIKAK